MVTREDIVIEARTWINTPVHYRSSAKGAGVDCIGLWIGVGMSLGLDVPELPYYGTIPREGMVRELLDAHMDLVWDKINMTSAPIILPGQLGLFSWGGYGNVHTAVLTGKGMIHAYAPLGRVVENNIDPWRKRLAAVYDVRGMV